MGKKHFCFFQTAETGNRAPDSGVKGSGANLYSRAPARFVDVIIRISVNYEFRCEPLYNHYPAKLIYLNFRPLEVVSRYRDPQPQVVENYSYFFNLRPNIYKS